MDDNCLLLHYVSVDRLGPAWQIARKWILAASETAGEYNEEDIIERLLTMQFHLFIAYDDEIPFGAMTVSIDKYPRITYATIIHLGSDKLSKMARMLRTFEAWAAAHGATRLRAYIRPDLEPKIKQFGFNTKFICTEKENGWK